MFMNYFHSTESSNFLSSYFFSMYFHVFLLVLLSLFLLTFLVEFLWYHYGYLTIIYNAEFNLLPAILTKLFLLFFYFPDLIIPVLVSLVFLWFYLSSYGRRSVLYVVYAMLPVVSGDGDGGDLPPHQGGASSQLPTPTPPSDVDYCPYCKFKEFSDETQVACYLASPHIVDVLHILSLRTPRSDGTTYYEAPWTVRDNCGIISREGVLNPVILSKKLTLLGVLPPSEVKTHATLPYLYGLIPFSYNPILVRDQILSKTLSDYSFPAAVVLHFTQVELRPWDVHSQHTCFTHSNLPAPQGPVRSVN